MNGTTTDIATTLKEIYRIAKEKQIKEFTGLQPQGITTPDKHIVFFTGNTAPDANQANHAMLAADVGDALKALVLRSEGDVKGVIISVAGSQDAEEVSVEKILQDVQGFEAAAGKLLADIRNA